MWQNIHYIKLTILAFGGFFGFVLFLWGIFLFVFCRVFFLFFDGFFFFFFLVFLETHPRHIPRLGVESELQLLAYTTATWDLNHG